MPEIKPTLHCIVAVNIHDKSIGDTCLIDKNRITSFYKRLTDFIQIPYNEIIIDNQNFSVEGVKNTIKKLQPDKNDVVVFAYSGHGFRFKNEESILFPQLALFTNERPDFNLIRENTINIEEIFNLIRAKGARLNLVFGDCCNNELKLERFKVEELNLHSWPIEWNKKSCIQLFENAKGSYLVAAAAKDQLAICNPVEGGFFTFSIYQFIETAFETFDQLDWQAIIKRAAEFTAEKSKRALCGKERCKQNAISRMVN